MRRVAGMLIQSTDSPSTVVRNLFRALDAERWDDAVALIDETEVTAIYPSVGE
jgi:hypothetical protein